MIWGEKYAASIIFSREKCGFYSRAACIYNFSSQSAASIRGQLLFIEIWYLSSRSISPQVVLDCKIMVSHYKFEYNSEDCNVFMSRTITAIYFVPSSFPRSLPELASGRNIMLDLSWSLISYQAVALLLFRILQSQGGLGNYSCLDWCNKAHIRPVRKYPFSTHSAFLAIKSRDFLLPSERVIRNQTACFTLIVAETRSKDLSFFGEGNWIRYHGTVSFITASIFTSYKFNFIFDSLYMVAPQIIHLFTGGQARNLWFIKTIVATLAVFPSVWKVPLRMFQHLVQDLSRRSAA